MGWGFTALEAAMAWGYRVGEWDREDGDAKARAIAHYLLKGKFQDYVTQKAKEQAEREAKQKDGVPTPNWSNFSGFSRGGR